MTTTANGSVNDKEAHEDGAAEALCDALHVLGRPASVADRPDRVPGSVLTVDAILDLDGIDG